MSVCPLDVRPLSSHSLLSFSITPMIGAYVHLRILLQSSTSRGLALISPNTLNNVHLVTLQFFLHRLNPVSQETIVASRTLPGLNQHVLYNFSDGNDHKSTQTQKPRSRHIQVIWCIYDTIRALQYSLRVWDDDTALLTQIHVVPSFLG